MELVQKLGLVKKDVFVCLALAVTLALHSCATPSTPPAQHSSTPDARPSPLAVQPGGNNGEAADFARAMTELTRQTWPKAHAVWNLELVPQEVAGDILTYRRHVTYCKATVSMNDEWLRQTESSQRAFLRSFLDALHKAPALPSGALDYYPNSSGEMLIKAGDRVVARGTYTRAKTDVRLVPGTFAQDRSSASQFSASFSIIREGAAVSLQGETNLPDGASILITLESQSYSGQTKVIVRGGRIATESFSNRGRPLSPGVYSLQLNVFDPKSGLMIEAKRRVTFFSSKTVELTFKPVKL